MDKTTLAGLVILAFKLGTFALIAMHARQARRAASEAREAAADGAIRQCAKDTAPALREAA